MDVRNNIITFEYNFRYKENMFYIFVQYINV